MSHSLLILRRAQKELASLTPEAYEKVKEALMDLGKRPRPTGCRKLKARKGWRLMVGDYRVIYDIDDQRRIVTVLHVGHRRDVYR